MFTTYSFCQRATGTTTIHQSLLPPVAVVLAGALGSGAAWL